jgi:LacI family transcriptional regulator
MQQTGHNKIMTKFSQMPTPRVTQQDIANAVGVSHVTVSHVLHRSRRSRVSVETQQEILRVAAEMGYTPRDVTTHTVALVIGANDLRSEVTSSILADADSLLRNHGFRMTVSTFDAASIGQAKNFLDQKTVDGVIFTDWYGKASRRLLPLPVPWVLLADADDVGSGVDQVAADTVQTARMVTEYLLARGHQQVCFVAGRAGIGFHERAKRGILEALQRAGMPSANLTTIHDDGPRSPDFEEEVIPLLKASGQPPTAVITISFGGAMVAMNRLHRCGFRVPEDVSIVSLTDSPRLQALRPAVTSTTAVGFDVVRLAVERLVQKIHQPETIPHRLLVPSEMIERESVATVLS